MGSLVLGTVQLGMDYGVGNQTGQPAYEDALRLVETACNNGVFQFDTAQGYGESEAVLGRIFRDLNISDRAVVVSKIHPELDNSDVDTVVASVEASLERLGLSQLECLMWHNEVILESSNDHAAKVVSKVKQLGLARNVGVSVYSPKLAVQALNTEWVDMVQLPGNILDRRFENAGVFDLADEVGKHLFLRSVFLQGLLLMPTDLGVSKIPPAREALTSVSQMAKHYGVSPLALCLGFVKKAYPNASILFGAETASQVEEVLEAWDVDVSDEVTRRVLATFDEIDERIVNPVFWKEF